MTGGLPLSSLIQKARLDSDDSSNKGATLNEIEGGLYTTCAIKIIKLISGIESNNDEVSNPKELSAVSKLMSDHEIEGPQQGWLSLQLSLVK
jgi:hypothetical protein